MGGAACIVDTGILLIAPDDCASPYGCKHSYRNSEFVGHHMDMIVFELPAFIELNMGLLAYGKGLMGESNSGTFWLSPNHYARASQGFDPSFNTLTDAVNFKAYYNYVYQMPLSRIAANPGMFQTGATFLFLSCDSNDEWGIGDSTTKFYTELTAGGMITGGKSIAGGVIHDEWNSYPCASGASPPSGSGCGSHTMSLRDYKIGLQYFSD